MPLTYLIIPESQLSLRDIVAIIEHIQNREIAQCLRIDSVVTFRF